MNFFSIRTIFMCLFVAVQWFDVTADAQIEPVAKLKSIDRQDPVELGNKGKLAYSPQEESFLLINKDQTVISVLVSKCRKPDGLTGLNTYGDYVELPGYAYSPNNEKLGFAQIKYIGIASSKDNSKWSLFELLCQNTKHYGLAFQVTTSAVNVVWLEPEQLNNVQATRIVPSIPEI